ncbi:MAG: glycoside hydrolase [Verrucomicrobiales bacterium]|jgi:hypothetical protein|nr:glycoside hydrolase [Verrucomicrobiales bacterium]
MRLRLIFLSFLLAGAAGADGGNLLDNPGFENNTAGWRELWTSSPGSGTLTVVTRDRHGGKQAAQLINSGSAEWNLEPAARVPVTTGDVVEWSAWVRRDPAGHGPVFLCAVLRDDAGAVVDWFFGEQPLTVGAGWQQVRAWFVVPAGVGELQPRLAGSGAADLWIDDATLVKHANLHVRRADDARAPLTVANAALEVSLNPADATISVLDRRDRRRYQSLPLNAAPVTDAAVSGHTLRYRFFHYDADCNVSVTLRLDGELPECVIELSASGSLTRPLRYPAPFATADGERVIAPLNEGIAWPVDDPATELFRLPTYSGGSGLCMAFWGVADAGGRGHLSIIETPDDAALRLIRSDGRLHAAAEWDAQRGELGYPRRLRWVFFNAGGHVAMAKRYRAHAQRAGLVKTLAEKRRANADLDRLVGAVNVWSLLGDPVGTVNTLRALGVERILWSNGESAEHTRALNRLDVLTGCYDVYQDIMNPALYPRLAYVDPHWIPAAWPDGLIQDASGRPIPGWEIADQDGRTMHPCGVLCDTLAPDHARHRIRAEQRAIPRRARFIDTTTASPWREDYHPAHPMTRGDSRRWRVELLRTVSEELGLVTGSETGHDAAVPHVAYFEGMMSLNPYRVPDAGREMQRLWHEVPPRVAKYQLGHEYRLPLWELVYHDCVIAHWYWGDYNNKLPALWDRRDLFNILYGTPPVFFLTREQWPAQQERFAQSYRDIAPVAHATAYSEMLDHRYLTSDRAVQQTVFANGTVVTVNFGDQPYQAADGQAIPARGFRVRY